MDIPKKVIDITGIELTPGEPSVCLGNGEQGFECCCDECDYFLLCFPEFDPEIQEKILPWTAVGQPLTDSFDIYRQKGAGSLT
ncbi:MAG: hypothetical protein IJX74_06690 [Clostridia bacterium]|nr:hypothetical protein [Clostridia bacterium]